MMKKLFLMILALCIFVLMTACGHKNSQSESSGNEITTESSSDSSYNMDDEGFGTGVEM